MLCRILVQHECNRNTSAESVLLLPKSGYKTEKLVVYLITWPISLAGMADPATAEQNDITKNRA
jgi:hypothetical protein